MRTYSSPSRLLLDTSFFVEENRKTAIDYKKEHNWQDLRIGKKWCSVGDLREDFHVSYDCDPDTFFKRLKQLHLDNP
jgi:hypothetical protein